MTWSHLLLFFSIRCLGLANGTTTLWLSEAFENPAVLQLFYNESITEIDQKIKWQSGSEELKLDQAARRLHLPPGHWLLGNTMPKSHAPFQFVRWTEQYGPVFSLKQGHRIFVIIGRHQAAIDIMEKEGANLADRPRSIAAQETLSDGLRVVLAGSPPLSAVVEPSRDQLRTPQYTTRRAKILIYPQ
ncbi:uncharacterized protein F5147DRAFT_763302 [Suillus discolor]|uniref:Uncharacterized protein n=1 Tax=Suillus discolor TaxID=1912936 RepID=A0A9P7EYH8_9AGAM|nr:uncharacterized protein F5147DRAFT_763302 [Suillus discolor]KAG2097937.1 hypothetical protein F5147DRAFT_763302 [Suillus discolor]